MDKKSNTKTDTKMETRKKKLLLTKWVKFLVDIVFYVEIVGTLLFPLVLRWGAKYYKPWEEHYVPAVIIYLILGFAAVMLLRELRRIFKTVLDENCFVDANAVSLRKMGSWSFFIVLLAVVRFIVYQTVAICVVILVFTFAGLFSKVLALVFEEAVSYKEDNDLTI